MGLGSWRGLGLACAALAGGCGGSNVEMEPRTPTESANITGHPPGCEEVRCPADTYCDVVGDQADCVPLPSCGAFVCPAGTECELKQVQCIRAPCPPQPTCVEADE